MSRQEKRYRVNLFRPKKGHMRDEVLIIFAILFGWALCTFGFQILLALCRGTGAGPPPQLDFLETHPLIRSLDAYEALTPDCFNPQPKTVYEHP